MTNDKATLRWEDVVRVAANQVSTHVGDEVAVLNLDQGVYYGLNAVGARVWELAQEPIRLDEIAAAISREYEVDTETVRRDVMELVQRLFGEGLVELQDGIAP